MNVLITNSHEPQAYTILRCLRPDAEKIVITVGEASVGGPVGGDSFQGMAAFSRFVDARYKVPHFAGEWLAGRLAAGNSEEEEAYIRRIEEICRLEKVDVIYPSLDPEVYLFAKNKQRFAQQGILTVVADPDVIRIPMDKALTIEFAQRVGFPCPRTWFPDSPADVERIPLESSPPWIVKPRFTAHGASMIYVEDAAELREAYSKVSSAQHSPIIQEYVEGGLRRNYYVTVGRDSEILSILTPQVMRTQKVGFKVSSKSCVSASTGPYVEELRALLRGLGLWGGYTIQTQIDPRDGKAKLLEINPRLGQHLWWRTGLGVNEPRICLQLARGETPSGNFRFPDGVLLLDADYDFFTLLDKLIYAAFEFLSRLVGRGDESGWSARQDPSESFLATLRLRRREYLNRRLKVLCPEVSNLLVDPYPCLRWFWFRMRPRFRYIRRRLTRALGVSRGDGQEIGVIQ
jgi:D-alanine-D-alanine ligase-like ATP-grasp enzyme